MRSTHFLLQRAAKQQFILPPSSLLGSASSAVQGVLSHLTDASARERYEQLVDSGVIQDRVLSKANHGSLMTMALFHQLQNPTLKQHKLEPKEFLEAIPRAIEVYTDTLGCLVRDLNEEVEKEESATTDEDEALSIAALKNQTIPPESNNPWHQQAKENPTSLAGRLSRMATPHLLDEHWFGANLFRVMAWTTTTATTQYVPGSSHVKSVALLTARVEEAPPSDGDDAFVDPDVPDDDRPIAAQWSVLYEMEQEFQQSSTAAATDPILSTADQYREILNENSKSTDGSKKEEESPSSPDPAVAAENTADGDSKKQDTTTAAAAASVQSSDKQAAKSTVHNSTESTTDAEETPQQRVTETSLVVAVLEAWVHKGEEPFRWRVCHIREAHEFR